MHEVLTNFPIICGPIHSLINHVCKHGGQFGYVIHVNNVIKIMYLFFLIDIPSKDSI